MFKSSKKIYKNINKSSFEDFELFKRDPSDKCLYNITRQDDDLYRNSIPCIRLPEPSFDKKVSKIYKLLERAIKAARTKEKAKRNSSIEAPGINNTDVLQTDEFSLKRVKVRLLRIPEDVMNNPVLFRNWSKINRERKKRRVKGIESENTNELSSWEEGTNNSLTDGYNTEPNNCSKNSQDSLNRWVDLSSFYDTDAKLNELTGLDDRLTLDALIKGSLKLKRAENNDNIPMGDRIIVTMSRLKTNFDFQQLAELFGINYKIIATCFALTIRHLAQVCQPLLSWTSYKMITALKTIAIRTQPQLEILIGISSCGMINYVSSMSNAGIEMVTPKIYHKEHSVSEAHMKARIEKLETFKFISEAIDATIVPFIDDIMTVLCGLLNYGVIN